MSGTEIGRPPDYVPQTNDQTKVDCNSALFSLVMHGTQACNLCDYALAAAGDW